MIYCIQIEGYMAYYKNTIHNNRLFIRCIECGDSYKRQHIAHMGIDLATGLWYCHRCGSGGRLTANQFLEYTSGITISMPETLIELDHYHTLPHILVDERYTLLISQQNIDMGYRQWAMRKPNGEVIGYHHRYAGGKQSENIGYRGLGYVGKELSSTNILRVVEGVYDVVLPDSVCVFGKITRSSIKLLQHYPLCLTPDTDIIYSRHNLFLFAKTVQHSSNVEYVEILPSRVKDAGDMFAYDQEARGKIVTRNWFINRMKEKGIL